MSFLGKSYRWKLLGAFLLVLVLGGWLIFSSIFKDNCVDTHSLETSVRISSEQLLSSFKENELAANSNYVEKIIEVKGEIRDISFLNNRYTI